MRFQDFFMWLTQDYIVLSVPLFFLIAYYALARPSVTKGMSQQFGLSLSQAGLTQEIKTIKKQQQETNQLMRESGVCVDGGAGDRVEDIKKSDAIRMAQFTSSGAQAWELAAEGKETYASGHAGGDAVLCEISQDDRVQFDHDKKTVWAYGAQHAMARAVVGVVAIAQLMTFHIQQKQQQDSLQEGIYNSVVALYLLPKNGAIFLGYELLQALANYSVHLAEHNHFQRFANQDGSGELWFHVASRTHPGTFDMREPGKLSCEGLVLILEARKVDALTEAFECLLDTALGLAHDLDAVLLDYKEQSLTQAELRRLRYQVIQKWG